MMHKLNSPVVKIYFRIPFTMYFIGRIIIKEENYKSKLYLFTKRFDKGEYFWNSIK